MRLARLGAWTAGLVLLAAAPAFAGGGSTTYLDPTGDSQPSTAPDIGGVTVSSDGAGMLTFAISVVNRPAYEPSLSVLLPIDADGDPHTGAPHSNGQEVLITFDRTGASLQRWNGTAMEPVLGSSLTATWANGPVFRVKASDLGPAAKFRFGVVALDIDMTTTPPTAGGDNAPDGNGTAFVYPKPAPPVAKPAPKHTPKPKPHAKKR
jgi:hypothetical protein